MCLVFRSSGVDATDVASGGVRDVGLPTAKGLLAKGKSLGTIGAGAGPSGVGVCPTMTATGRPL